MAEIRINGFKENTPVNFCSEMPEWKTVEVGDNEENNMFTERGGKFLFPLHLLI